MMEKINIQNPLSPQSVDLYDLEKKTESTPSIMAISPHETNIFVAYIPPRISTFQTFPLDMVGYDLLKKQTMTQSKSLLQNTMALTIIPQSNHVLVGSKERFGIVEFLKEYPNTKAFCHFDSPNKFLDFDFSVKLVEPSDTGSVWLVADDEENLFYCYNMTNDNFPQQIASYQLRSDVSIRSMSLTRNRAFIETKTDVLAFSVSSDLTPLGSLVPKRSFQIENFQISNSENITYVIQRLSQEKIQLNAINFTNFASIIENPFAELEADRSLPQNRSPKQ